MDHTIRNFDALAENALREDALSIAEAGYAAVDVGAALARTLRIEGDELHIGDVAHRLAGRGIYFVGIGKCAAAAAEALEKMLGDRLTGGIALDVASHKQRHLSRVEAYIGTHPLPSEANERATRRIVEFLSRRARGDLVIMLVSGGGSTLLCLHEAPMTCLDESALFTALTAKGATIRELNTVRKHTSLARGGGLARFAYPADVVSLIVSDVPGNDLGYIASGPSVRDTSTVADAQAILARYGITPPATTIFVETPKEARYFERVTNELLLSGKHALAAMRAEAARRGYAAIIKNDRFAGEAREIGRSVAEELRDAAPKTALLYAGESTVTLAGATGNGGRNQEVALAALERVADDALVLPFASDGRDNTDHAGAIADAVTLEHARAHDLAPESALVRHASYDFFAATGDALITGYTGTNVSDLIIALKH